jgi:hypothetical protein
MKGATARPWQPAQFDRLSRSGLSCHRIVAAIYCAFSNNPGCFATLAAIRRKREAPAGGSLDRGLRRNRAPEPTKARPPNRELMSI